MKLFEINFLEKMKILLGIFIFYQILKNHLTNRILRDMMYIVEGGIAWIFN